MQFAKLQEPVRKDVERALSVRLARFHLLNTPCRLGRKEYGISVPRACIIIHNMRVESRRNGYESEIFTNAVDDESVSHFGGASQVTMTWENKERIPLNAALVTCSSMVHKRHTEFNDEIEQWKLHIDLVEHNWSRRGTIH